MQAFEAFGRAMADEQQRLADHVRDVDQKFAGAVDALSDAIDELGDRVRDRRAMPEAAE